MKIIDFKPYDEKLKISPIGLKDFDKIRMNDVKTYMTIDMIESYDIVQTRNKRYFISFFNIDLVDQTNCPDFIKLIKLYDKYCNKIFKMFLCIYENHPEYLDGSIYEENLIYKGGFYKKEWNIINVWRHFPNKVFFDADDRFEDDDMMKIIEKYKYKLIYHNEKN